MQIDGNALVGGIVAIIVAVLGSSWFSAWAQSHNSNTLKQAIVDMQKAIANIKSNEEALEAKNARRRLLRFNDELLNNVYHRKEYFDDVIGDITEYRRFCDKNPDFLNGKATLAIENIERVYRICMEKKSFL